MELPSFNFHPRLLDLRRGYSRERLLRDVASGLTVGVVALPLAMAFGIASGVKPEAGLITAIVGGFLVSALGGSKVQIGGPAGAFIVIVYGIVETYGLPNLLVATMLAGLMLFAMGFFRLGSLVRLIPVPIVIGFTNGIALLIAISQIRDLLGLHVEKMPGEMFAMLGALVHALPSLSAQTVAMSAASLVFLFGWTALRARLEAGARLRFLALIPGPILLLAAATTAQTLLQLDVATIGSRFGGIPRSLPAPALPSLDWEQARRMFSPALTIALLAAIESLLCARVADALSGDRHNPNQELMAQGVANLASPLFGGIPVTGNIARTVTNIRSSAESPVSGLVHAATLVLVVLAAAPLAANVPLAALASILMQVAWNMGEWREFARLRHFSNTYRTLLVGILVLTIVFDLSVAVEAGLVLACLFFVYRMSTLTHIAPLEPPAGLAGRANVLAVSLYGSLFFGAVGKIEALSELAGPADSGAREADNSPRVLVVQMRQMVSIDTTGIEALDSLRQILSERGVQLLVCEVNAQPLSLMRRSGWLARLGEEHCLPSLEEAWGRAGELASRQIR
ncbi:MAG: SulP family inorganic anion transporter [Candidatus Protistobacter heckmanni]|nr:SulP family inorganic anion transporter [Candidatus Protistobacter heckmanni]